MKSLKNLFHVLNRFRTASALNLFGLSIAFASFIIIMMQVRYEQQYDACHQNADRIFRLEWNGDGTGFMAVVSRPLAYALEETSSHVEAMTLMDPMLRSEQVIVRQGQEERSYKEEFSEVSPSLVRMFTFEWIEGGPDALDKPAHVIMPQSVAKRIFPDESAVGKTLETEDSTWVVGAVYKDLPRNSTVKNKVYYPTDRRNENWEWGNANNYAYVMFDNAAATEGFLEALVDHIDETSFGAKDKKELLAKVHSVFRLNPLPNMYYSNDVKYVFTETGSRQTTFLLICIAFIVILIAGINFTNFTTALTPMRIKSINTQKVLGSTPGRLRRRLVGEGIFIAFLSFLLSLLIVFACRGTFIDNFISPDIDLIANRSLLGLAAVVSVLTGFLAGLYPAFYMTSFPPAMVLKGSFGLSMQGRRLRTLLLCIQYVASISLLIIATFMMMQNKRMLRSSFGYDNHQILTVEVSNTISKSQDAFANALKQSPAIEEVAFSFAYLSCMDDCPTWGRNYNGEHFMFNCFCVTRDFLKVLGVKVTEGRDFLESDFLTQESFIFNQAAKEQYNLELGEGHDINIIGFMPNIVYASLRSPVSPMAFLMIPEEQYWLPMPLSVCYIRMKEGVSQEEAKKAIGATIKQFDALYPYDIKPLDYNIEDAYRAEKNISSLISLFGILSILISIVGIYGLVVFETEYKRREIGLRKVFGSTTSEVMSRFNSRYMRIILVCTVVAVPISYYAVDKWLDRFTLRVPIYWWVFVLAFLLIAIVTLATTTWQNYRAASANPVDSLKSE